MPVDAQLTLGDDFVATPTKASAVTEANKNLAQGDQKGALEKLKLAHVDVNFTMAVLPLNTTIANVDQAAALIGQGKYYEANAALKTAQDNMRFDVIDAVAVPRRRPPPRPTRARRRPPARPRVPRPASDRPLMMAAPDGSQARPGRHEHGRVACGDSGSRPSWDSNCSSAEP